MTNITEIDELPDSALIEMSPDTRAELIEDFRERLENLQTEAKLIARAIELAESDILRLQGVPTTEDYTRAYERIKGGESPTEVRIDFQAIYTTVSDDAFHQAMSRRRRWGKKREAENFKD